MRGSGPRMTVLAISKSAGSPALFCWPRLRLGNGLHRNIGLRRTRLRYGGLGGVSFRGDLARRRLIRAFGRQQWRNRRHRVIDIPLADAIAAAPLREVEVDVVLVVPVRSGP